MLMNDIPNEILSEILEHLESEPLKNARLTCRHWANAGAGKLFQRIYFAPHEEIMNVFTYITSDPTFAANITELVYDARLFWKFWTHPYAYSEACIIAQNSLAWGDIHEGYETSMYDLLAVPGFGRSLEAQDGPEARLEKVAESHGEYIERFKHQKETLDSGLDFEVLCQGLKKLPNLRMVSVFDCFCWPTDFRDVHELMPYWYELWSADIWGDILPPMSKDLCSRMVENIEEEEAENIVDNPLDGCVGDLRGIANCLKAVALHSTGMTHLHYGSQLSNLPFVTLNDITIATNLENIARNLTCLKLDISASRNGQGERVVKADVEAVSALGRILEQAQNLRSFSASSSAGYHASQQISGKQVWPYLSLLELGELPMRVETLKNLCQQHKNTLRELRLRNIDLDIERGLETWNDVGKALEGILKLRKLSLLGLYSLASMNHPGSPSPHDWTLAFGHQVMGWIPKDMLGMEYEDDDSQWLLMWHM